MKRPLVFLFKGSPEDSGACRYPGCVTFQAYLGGKMHQEVMEWLRDTCPNGYQFGHAKVWRVTGKHRYRDSVPVLHIFDRGIAALFKMMFARTEHEQRDYLRQRRAITYRARAARKRA